MMWLQDYMMGVMREQWGLPVRRDQAEAVRESLARDRLLDTRLRPRQEGDRVIFAVIRELEGSVRAMFDERPEKPLLPSHEMVGGIAIMDERDLRAAARLLAARPSLHTVLLAGSKVEGTYRTRRFEILAGVPTTRTRYVEYGLRFEIDLAFAYFSARLSTERQRICSMAAPEERVLDMFSGVGPGAITLSRRVRGVVASELNPDAVLLMRWNLALNHAGNVIPVLSDAAHLAHLPWKFDRIVMNLPHDAYRFLPAAFALSRPGAVIHLHVIQASAGEFLPVITPFPVRAVDEHTVRSFSPGRWHVVYDIRCEK
jgi:tRNA (guanine37-N1)-methyltransferase